MTGTHADPDPALTAARRADLIHSLHSYRAHLLQELAITTAAIEQYGAVKVPRAQPHPARRGTITLLRAYIATNPGRITEAAAYEWLQRHGWESAANDRHAAVSTGLANFATWGHLVRTRQGVYETPAAIVAAHQAADANRPV